MDAVSVLVIAGGIYLGYVRIATSRKNAKNFSEETPQFRKRRMVLPVLIVVFGLYGLATWMSASYVSAREGAIVEIQLTGKLYRLNKGLHVFPFDPRMIPLIAHTEKVSFSATDGDNTLTLGNPNNVLVEGISSSTSSPGNPPVFFAVKVIVVPNPDELLTLYRLYGSNYLDGYVKDNFASALKSVQGKHPFDYLAKNRTGFEEEVRSALETKLSTADGDPILHVTFVNVVEYDYTDELNGQLDEIVKANNDAEAAKARVLTAEQDALAVQKTADGQKQAAIAIAEGEKQAAQKRAEAAAYAKKQEALGIIDIQNALSASPTYLQLQQIQQWNGVLPQFIGGEAPIPFINVPVTAQPTPTVTPSP